jgi:hypothetical protein
MSRFIIKFFITIIVLIFFSGVLRGCATATQNAGLKGINVLFATIIMIGIVYGIWSYAPKKESSKTDIKLKK